MTVGFIKEAAFIAKARGQKTHFQILGMINGIRDVLCFSISPAFWMEVSYDFGDKSQLIWREKIDGDDSFFGIESMDSISHIMVCIQNGDTSWKDKYFYDQKQSI